MPPDAAMNENVSEASEHTGRGLVSFSSPSHRPAKGHQLLRKISMKKKTAATLTAGAICLGTAAGAYAYWTTSGSGTGSAKTGTDSGVSVAQSGSVTNLTPDSPAQNIDYTITNPASTNQYIAKVTVAITSIKDANGNVVTGCTTSDFALTQPTNTPGDLANGAHTYSNNGATLRLINNPNANQDACKSVTVALGFTASPS